MIVFEVTGTEQHPVYKELEAANLDRQYGFLHSIVEASLKLGRPFLSQQVLRALNYHAIACLHVNAGEFRPCEVRVGHYEPPMRHKVPALMDDLVNTVNLIWERTDAVALASFVLWKINQIHPFINGNGRTARAACHFVLCVKLGQWLPGAPIVPELLRKHRDEYVAALRYADEQEAQGAENPLEELAQLVARLLDEQLNGAA